MNYSIPVDVCPVPCKNPLVVFLEYVKENTAYADTGFNPNNPDNVKNLVTEVGNLINFDGGFTITDNQCDNVCCPTCNQTCFQYFLTTNIEHFAHFINDFAPPIPKPEGESKVLPCCLNVIASGTPDPSYPYDLLNCKFNTFSCCNKFNYKLVHRLMKFVTKYDTLSSDVEFDLNSLLSFFVEFGTFDHESAVNTLLDELETFAGAVPYALLTSLLDFGIVVNCTCDGVKVMSYEMANAACKKG